VARRIPPQSASDDVASVVPRKRTNASTKNSDEGARSRLLHDKAPSSVGQKLGTGRRRYHVRRLARSRPCSTAWTPSGQLKCAKGIDTKSNK
jgi:hypothetical protein